MCVLRFASSAVVLGGHSDSASSLPWENTQPSDALLNPNSYTSRKHSEGYFWHYDITRPRFSFQERCVLVIFPWDCVMFCPFLCCCTSLEEIGMFTRLGGLV